MHDPSNTQNICLKGIHKYKILCRYFLTNTTNNETENITTSLRGNYYSY